MNDSGRFDYTYVYHEGQQVVQVDHNGVKEFIFTDHLGSSSAVTDFTGAVIEQTTYEPFGAIAAGGEKTRYDYEGKELDAQTGEYDFHFRKFSPGLGIFTQPDSLIPNTYDPQSLNRYMFERGNSYSNIDEDGHIALPAALVAIGLGFSFLAAGFHVSDQIVEIEEQEGRFTERDLAEIYKEATVSGLSSGKGFRGKAGGFGGKKISKEISTNYFESRIRSSHLSNVHQHIQNNQNLNPQNRATLLSDVRSSAQKSGRIRWYYNPADGKYQLTEGREVPSNLAYQKVAKGGSLTKVRKSEVVRSKISKAIKEVTRFFRNFLS